MGYNEESIVKTLIYSDIFHFPLSKDELWRFLLSKKRMQRADFEQALNTVQKISYKNGYYCLSGREAIIKQRIANKEEVKKKLRIAKTVAASLSYIPTILFIGLSGGVAMGNVKKSDDIDLFIITKAKSLFMTRLFVLGLLEMLHVRRARSDTDTANKVCVNLLIEETNIVWRVEQRDLYTAHEITQVKPLFERKNMYQRFLESNAWVSRFLPNALENQERPLGSIWQRNYYSLAFVAGILRLLQFETMMRAWQKQKMKKHQTNETVADSFLALHPFDYRVNTLRNLKLKMRQLGLLTNI